MDIRKGQTVNVKVAGKWKIGTVVTRANKWAAENYDWIEEGWIIALDEGGHEIVPDPELEDRVQPLPRTA